MINKSFIFGAAVLAISAIAFSSCSDDSGVDYLSATVTIDESSLSGIPSPESYTVTFTNVGTGDVLKKISTGTSVSTDSLITGVYNITAQAQFEKGGFSYNYIGTSSNVEVNSDGINCVIKVSATKSSALVFKEIFYSAGKTPAAKNYFRDQFYEIYNNSDKTVYADGICLGEALSSTVFDFTGTAGLTGEASDYIFFGKLVWQVPGDGNDYPIAPGESFVIAQYATDHTAADKNPNSLDLSTADFETYIDDYSSNQTDCNAINLNLVCNASGNNSKQYFTSVFGSAMVIFYPSTTIKNTDYIESVNQANNMGREILKSDVLDAVDCIKNATTAKRLEAQFDAGSIFCSGIYVNESIYRKTASTNADGRIVYQDTNNSTEDFQISTTPTIRRNSAGRPSWSTWTVAQ